MKIFIILITILFFGIVSADIGAYYEDPEMATTEVKEEKPKSICPKTLMNVSCMSCHTAPSFKIIKPPLDEGYNIPHGASITIRNEKKVIKYTLDEIDDDRLSRLFEWLQRYPEFNYLILEVDSYGGSMWNMKRIVGYMDEYKARGGTIETVCHSKAMSAGFVIFLNGSVRKISETAELMWHELLTFKMFAVDTPATLQDEADTMKHFTDVQHEWIAKRCNLTKEEIDKLIHKKELWVSGREAVEKYGFADELIK